MKEYMIDSERGIVYRLIDGVYRIVTDIAHFKACGSYEVGYFPTKSVGE